MRMLSTMSLVLMLAACGTRASNGLSPDPICDRYLACDAPLDPNGFPALLTAYGNSSSCWVAPGGAAACSQACAAALTQLGTQCKCTSDADCQMPTNTASILGYGGTPRCEPISQRCVACNSNADCSRLYPVCYLADHRCVNGCGNEKDCTAPLPACVPVYQGESSTTNTMCAECDDLHACPLGGTCGYANTCVSPCEQTLQCIESTGYPGMVGDCLKSDTCCPNEATCSAFQPLRACLIQHCSTPDIDVPSCEKQFCAELAATCHQSGC